MFSHLTTILFSSKHLAYELLLAARLLFVTTSVWGGSNGMAPLVSNAR